MDYVQLAAAFVSPGWEPSEGGSKLRALHTLREIRAR